MNTKRLMMKTPKGKNILMRLKENNKNNNDSCQDFSSAQLLLRGERRSRRTMNTLGVVRGSECPIKGTKQSEAYFQQDYFRCIEQGTFHLLVRQDQKSHNYIYKHNAYTEHLRTKGTDQSFCQQCMHAFILCRRVTENAFIPKEGSPLKKIKAL